MKKLLMIVLVSIMMNSCYTSNKANKDIKKAYINYPELVAKKTSEWFPCDLQIIKVDSLDNKKSDSLINDLNNRIQNIHDTINNIVYRADSIKTKQQIKKIQKELMIANNLINELKQSQPVFIYRSFKVTDSARIYHLDFELNESKKSEIRYRNKQEQLLKICIWLIIALGVSLFFNFYKK